MATQKKLVAVVTGWVEVEVEKETSVEDILKAASVEPAENDEFWTDRTTGVALNDTTTDQVLLVIRDIPDLDDEDEEEDEDEDEDEEEDPDKKKAGEEAPARQEAGAAAGEGGGDPGAANEPAPGGGEPAGATAGI